MISTPEQIAILRRVTKGPAAAAIRAAVEDVETLARVESAIAEVAICGATPAKVDRVLRLAAGIRLHATALRECEREGDFHALPPADRPCLGKDVLRDFTAAVQDLLRPADVSVIVLDKARFARAPQDERERVLRGALGWLAGLAPEVVIYVGAAPERPTADKD